MRGRTGVATLIALALLPAASLAARTEVRDAWAPAGGGAAERPRST